MKQMLDYFDGEGEKDKGNLRVKDGFDGSSIGIILDRFMEGIESGKWLHKGREYARGTVEVWRSFRKLYLLFDSEYEIKVESISQETIERFSLLMEDLKFMPNTRNKYMACFRALLSYSFPGGDDEKQNILELFKAKRVSETEQKTRVYLDSAELLALQRMKLAGRDDLARDLFIIGCLTCQRFSDIIRIEKANVATTTKGTPYLIIRQQKTGKFARVPLTNRVLKRILAKYDGNAPKMSRVELNKRIKMILHRLSDEVPSLANGIISLGEWHPKWSLVTTHTARRSGITNLYAAGRLTNEQIMFISGHSSFRNFKQYIRLSEEDTIDAIAMKLIKI